MGYKLKRILLWVPKRDTQGPCPDGFHVPTKDEWVALCGILTSTFGLARKATTIGTYLKMPMAGGRNYGNADVTEVGARGAYWSSTSYDAIAAYSLDSLSYDLAPQSHRLYNYGYSVRGFKDFPIIPTSSWTTLYDGSSVATGAGVFYNATDGLISISGDGVTWYTIMDKNLGATTVFNQGDTLTDANCGYFYQRGNNYGFAHSGTVTTSNTQVDASSYGPGNYYSSSTFITTYPRDSSNNQNLRGGVTKCESVEKQVRPALTPITTPGIYHNATLGLISMSGDGQSWITIADKNLGATNTDVTSTDSYGYFYQRGNNYAFLNSGNVTTNSNQVNTSNYGPGNYYNSSTFIIRSTRSDWSSPSNDNLWGGVTGTVDAMRGPCPEGYHIPTHDEWNSVWGILKNSLGLPNSYTTLPTYLKMPLSGHRGYDDAIVYMYGTNGFYWSSTAYSGNVVSYYFNFGQNYSTVSADNAHYRGMGFSIRPFKNESVQPDSSWTKLY